MPKLKGITVILYERIQEGTDPFNAPIFGGAMAEINNVLVAPEGSAGEVMFSETDLQSRRSAYILGIPKGDTHHWENAEVEFFGRRWKVIGMPTEGIEGMIPLYWNKKVRVEAIE